MPAVRLSSRESYIRNLSGFTIVELVIVILVLSIISAVMIGRFSGTNSFNGVVLRDQIVALTRLAQQSSFGRSGVEFVITPNVGGDRASLAVSETNGIVNETVIDITSVSLTTDNNVATSCSVSAGANSVTSAAPLTIQFGELGDVTSAGVAGGMATITSSVRICIDADADTSVCVSPTGFAYLGNCDVD